MKCLSKPSFGKVARFLMTELSKISDPNPDFF